MSRLNSCTKKFLTLLCIWSFILTMSYLFIFHHATLGNIHYLSNGKNQMKKNASILEKNQSSQLTPEYYDLELMETTTKLNSRIKLI